MKAKMFWANLAVADIKRTIDFYTSLGVKPNKGAHTEDIASFVFGDNDFVINFFRKEKLEPALCGKAADLTMGNEIIFSISAGTKEEVSAWVEKALESGGKLHREPSSDENGYYYCVFSDPDGHKFNVLLM